MSDQKPNPAADKTATTPMVPAKPASGGSVFGIVVCVGIALAMMDSATSSKSNPTWNPNYLVRQPATQPAHQVSNQTSPQNNSPVAVNTGSSDAQLFIEKMKTESAILDARRSNLFESEQALERARRATGAGQY